jgi:hypothetical protein
MRILKEDCLGLTIDIQEKLFPHIFGNESLLFHTEILIQGLTALQVPQLLTEQYPKGLGETVYGIGVLLEGSELIEKTTFSCCGASQFENYIKGSDKKYIIISGIETHVCVMQTALDLLAWGKTPVIVENCTSSRKVNDKEIALKRLQQAGAIITTYESILLELCNDSHSPEFKVISKLIK